MICLAAVVAFRTATLEAADMGGGIDRAARFSGERNSLGGSRKAKNSRNKSLGVGMVGMVENGVGRASFHQLAEVHDENAIAQQSHYIQIMR